MVGTRKLVKDSSLIRRGDAFTVGRTNPDGDYYETEIWCETGDEAGKDSSVRSLFDRAGMR